MSLLSWNCRGLGNAAIVKELRDMAKNYAPTVLCVLETQVHKARVEGLKSTLGYANAFAVNNLGHSGGLGLFGTMKYGWRFYRTRNITLMPLLPSPMATNGG